MMHPLITVYVGYAPTVTGIAHKVFRISTDFEFGNRSILNTYKDWDIMAQKSAFEPLPPALPFLGRPTLNGGQHFSS
jgi:hypothetical protein